MHVRWLGFSNWLVAWDWNAVRKVGLIVVCGIWERIWNCVGILIGGALNAVGTAVLVCGVMDAVGWSGLFLILRVLESWQVFGLIRLV